MNLHEYQAKDVFHAAGMPVARYGVVRSVEECDSVLRDIGSGPWVCKVQVHAGGRGKVGGVKLYDDPKDVRDFVSRWVGNTLVTKQTGEQGRPVNDIMIGAAADITKEFYLAILLDRAQQKLTIVASAEGGGDIEEVAAERPDAIIRKTIDPAAGYRRAQGRDIGFRLGMNVKQAAQCAVICEQAVSAFMKHDLTLLEINPLAILADGTLSCVDAKISVDDSAAYRQKKLFALRDETQEVAMELRAEKAGLSYVRLEGTIGCMVNGAGLAMATMDTIHLYGGAPANFLDVGGSATKERVSEAFSIITADKSVKAILVNIFGGIVRCDLIAEGIVEAVKETGLQVPVVVRLQGNSAVAGRKILLQSSVAVTPAETLSEAAKLAVECAQQ